MTAKQQKYFEGLVEGKNKMQAALDAGYSENTAKTASQNIESTHFQSWMEKALAQNGVTTEYIIDRIKEGFNAEKIIASWADPSPDYEVRLKYLLTALKLYKLI